MSIQVSLVGVRVPSSLQSLFKLSFCSIKHESFAPLSTDKGVFSWAYSFGPHDGSSVFLLPGHPTRKVIILFETTKHLFVFNIKLTYVLKVLICLHIPIIFITLSA